jgi:hypothetical protein
MRVVEHVVQRIGVVITGVPSLADKSWFQIIDKTGKAISGKFPDEKDPNRIKWELILGHLQTIRIAWRNTTMHPKETYTEEEAEDVLRGVKTLLREIVKII